jgi:hypothetical protein
MYVTMGTDADTGMTSLTFDGSGRTVQLTPNESVDFEYFLRGIKATGKMTQESIGSKAVHALQLLGEAIEEGDPETISALWLGSGEKIVEAGILNNVIEKIQFENPFSLYYINDPDADKEDMRKALVVSKQVKKIIDDLAKAIIELEITCVYNNLLPQAADDIKAFRDTKVGLFDTASREAMVDYFEGLLEPIFDAVDYTEMRQDFYNHL